MTKNHTTSHPVIRMTVHRVTSKTKTPYLARIKQRECSGREPFILWIPKVIKYEGYPPFARAIVISAPKNSFDDLQPGAINIVNHFPGIERIVFQGIPRSFE